MGKFVLLGLDGGAFEMLDVMAETGRLPVLGRLLREGARGPLLSTVPPVTCPAWPTMYTGRNPGAHGFASFRIIEPGSIKPRTGSLRDVICPRLWSVLNGHGVRTGVFNVPATYPAEPVDGFMVSGMPAPPDAAGAVHPQRYREEFARAFPNYDCNGSVPVGLFRKRSKRRWLLEQLRQNLLTRRAALEWSLDREPVDFLWVVLELVDRLSHAAYGFLTPGSAWYDTPDGREVRRQVLELLQVQDEIIGWILDRMGPDPDVMVVSDHGFAWKPRQFDMCGWLMANGYLAPQAAKQWKERLRSKARRAMYGSVIGKRLWESLAKLVRRATKTEAQHLREVVVDWGQSRVVPCTYAEYGLRVNSTELHEKGVVAPEEYDALVDAVVDGLRSVRDPENGEPVFHTVVRRDEVYSGGKVKLAPDILFVTAKHYVHRVLPLWEARPDREPVGPTTDYLLHNNHDREGIFAASGGPFGSGQVSDARILDVMPTVLYAMGLPVPNELEGNALEAAFRDDYRSSHPIQRTDAFAAPADASREAAGYSEEEEKEITERLRGLGYM